MAKTNWYSEIPYERKRLREYCANYKTDCPFGVCTGRRKKAVKVGSVNCVICGHFLQLDKEKQIVKCTNPLNLE